jgi:hypothetical protein
MGGLPYFSIATVLVSPAIYGALEMNKANCQELLSIMALFRRMNLPTGGPLKHSSALAIK